MLRQEFKHFSKSISIPNHNIFERMLYGFFDVNSETGISQRIFANMDLLKVLSNDPEVNKPSSRKAEYSKHKVSIFIADTKKN